MSDVQNSPELDQAIQSLKKKADILGIAYKSNVSVATLQKAINDKMEGTGVGESTHTLPTASPQTPTSTKPDVEALIKAAHKLVRVIITPIDQTKATNLESELISAGNSHIGTITRLVPFGVEWHVEQVILNALKEKKFQQFIKKKGQYGVDSNETRYVPAYSITILDPLTEDELKNLALSQMRSGATE
ncbi:hypothetical protein nACB1_010 [Acinetobacter phage nACB1]|nr:hypothetical protein nACB1_010 [Acinetobacter phage nACB1]